MAAGDSQLKFPIYVVVDVTASMAGVIQQFNQILVELFKKISDRPRLAKVVLLSVVSFSDDAYVELPLAEPTKDYPFPSLSAKGSARYSGVFNLLKELIERDVAGLKASGVTVLRPAVFFISDGAPIDGDDTNGESRTWSVALKALTSESFPYRPNIVAFGIGAADPSVIQEVASRPEFAFLSSLHTDSSIAIIEFGVSLERSIINSAETALAGEARLVVANPEGFVQIPDSL
jgi:uncharacterized protein YegL